MPTIDISQVVSEWGTRYTKEGQTMKQIVKELFAQTETEKFFRKIPHDQDYYKSAYATIDEVVQAFSVPFVKKATLTFQPWETKLGEFKIDDEFVPDRFRASWLGFLVDIKKVDRSKWPIMMWYISQMLIPASHRDMETKIAFWGWEKTGYNAAPTVDGPTLVREYVDESTLTHANASMDGLRTTIIKMVAASRATVIATGALSADPTTFCTQIEDFMEAVTPELRSQLDYLFMSEDLVNRYMDGRRAKYNTYWPQEGALKQIKNTSSSVQKLRSMDTSEKIFASPAMNRIMPIHQDNTGRFDVQKADRAIKSLTDWKKVLTFDVPELVVTNDLENSITAGDVTAHYS